VRDVSDGRIWSTGHQPLGRAADDCEVVFSADRAEFRRRDGGIETRWEIAVSPENNAEVRRVTLTNHDAQPRELELTSYAEVTLNPRRADQAHPAFGKLFLETEFLADRAALLCRRRPRAQDQEPIWAVHVLSADGPVSGDPQYETDRRAPGPRPFHRRPRRPGLGGGPVRHHRPGARSVFNLRYRVRVPRANRPPSPSRPRWPAAVKKPWPLAGTGSTGGRRAADLARFTAKPSRDLGLCGRAQLFQRLAGYVIYTGSAFRPPDVVAANRLGQPGLWPHGIFGDRSIVPALPGTDGSR
jgi:cyclic beta-1,2-glucan synthetase